MNLTEKLKSVGRIMGLAAALYSCGGNKPQGCTVDSDCHTPQVCVQSECKDPAEDDKLNCITMLDKVYDACCHGPYWKPAGLLYCTENFTSVNGKHVQVAEDYPWASDMLSDCCIVQGVSRSKLHSDNSDYFHSGLNECLQIYDTPVLRDHLNCALAVCENPNSPQREIEKSLFTCKDKYFPHGR